MSKRVTIENLIVCLEELADIRPLTSEQRTFQGNANELADYLKNSGEFAMSDTVVEFI